jgi:hypothetical protein
VLHTTSDSIDALCRVGSLLLENKDALKCKKTRAALFDLLATPVIRCSELATPAVIAGLAHALQNHEHVAEHVSSDCLF